MRLPFGGNAFEFGGGGGGGVMARSRRTNRAGLACQTHCGGKSPFSTVAVCGFCSCVGRFRAEDN